MTNPLNNLDLLTNLSKYKTKVVPGERTFNMTGGPESEYKPSTMTKLPIKQAVLPVPGERKFTMTGGPESHNKMPEIKKTLTPEERKEGLAKAFAQKEGSIKTLTAFDNKGMSKDKVMKLQQDLIDYGYGELVGKVDGK